MMNFYFRLNHEIEINNEHIINFRGKKVALPRSLWFLSPLNEGVYSYEELQETHFPVYLIDSLIESGLIEVWCGNDIFPSILMIYLKEQFPQLFKRWPLSYWFENDLPKMVWIGLPYESPRELHGSTALGCAAIIEDLSFKECPVLGLIPFKNPEKSAEEIFLKSWSAIKSQGVLVGLIGGDHRVSYSCIKSLKTIYEKKSFVHLQLDAHHDLYESNPEVDRLSPANFNLALFIGNLIKHLILIGCRDNRYYIERAKKEGFSVFETLDGIKKDIFGQGFHWHLSIDIDVLDPAVCAGVTNPLIHGWSFHRMKNTLRNIFLIRRPDSVSIVEATSEDEQTINIAADLCIFIKELYSD